MTDTVAVAVKTRINDIATAGTGPVADSDGCDANIRQVRITLSTNFNAAGSFQLRYRVLIR